MLYSEAARPAHTTAQGTNHTVHSNNDHICSTRSGVGLSSRCLGLGLGLGAKNIRLEVFIGLPYVLQKYDAQALRWYFN